MTKSSEEPLQCKRRIFENLGSITQSLASPARLRILQILSNKPCTVEVISEMADENIGNTSQHLQRMLRAGLVRCEKQGVRRIYSLTNNKILDIWLSLQELAIEIAPQIQVDENYLSPAELCSDLELSQILKLVKLGKAVLVDSRTVEEFESSPAKGALNFPASQLSKMTASLSKTMTVFVFCRGRYCVLANQVVTSLRKKGFKAYRLKETSYQINAAM
ncbi:MAG: hypothetical protein B7Y39_08865 [Bdellovibrio sp. 28-41-41]|nr:MAG: hypothetical protein B7Y39_08865 [Bdellovibrio sp. 28-41-41]